MPPGFNGPTSSDFHGEASSPRSATAATPRGFGPWSSRPPGEFVPKYLPGMFGESPPQAVREELASIMSDFHPVGFRLMATALAHADTRDLLPNIRVPTLLVWGGADVRSPTSVAHQLHGAIPGARLAIIPGAGHVSNLEAPGRFNAEVRDFCLSVTLA